MELKLSDIHKSFGANNVLKGISFKAKSGSALGLLGRNGAGKTTTMRIIMGVFPPNSGHVLVDERPIDRNSISLGYLPEEHGLYPKLPVDEQLLYLAKLRGVKTRDAKDSISHWLKRLGMQEYSTKKLLTLSKGNQQKIQLAAALITNPQIVILDEPFSGLDPVNATLLKEIVKELIGDGRIVLFSSHQMNYVEEFCDTVAILHQGEIVLDGAIDEIKRSYDRNIIALKSRGINMLKSYCEGTLSDIVVETETTRDELLVTLKHSKDMNRLMSSLAGQGFEIDNIGVHEPSLSEIFIQYTGDDEKEAV